MDPAEFLTDPEDEQGAALLEALRKMQERQQAERAVLQGNLDRQQGQAGGLRTLSLLTSLGDNPLLRGIQRAAGEQGGQMEGLAARTESRLAGSGGNLLDAIRLQQGQQRLKQAAEAMRAQEGRFQRTQAQSAEQQGLNRTSREKAAAIMAGDKATQNQLQNEAELRKEVQGHKVVQEYQASAVALDKVRKAAADPTPANDLALVFAYMKTLDPSSAVREGEFANAQNAAGVPDRVINAYNRAVSGKLLNPEQRQEFVRGAEGQYSAVKQRAESLIKGYRNVAEQSGVNVERVIVPGTVVPDVDLNAPASGAQKPAKVLYSPSRNRTREIDASGKVIREYEGKPNG